MARVTGLEPATSGVTGRRSNQLSYTRVSLGAAPLWQRNEPVNRPQRLLVICGKQVSGLPPFRYEMAPKNRLTIAAKSVPAMSLTM